jgi:hypothetical protein
MVMRSIFLLLRIPRLRTAYALRGLLIWGALRLGGAFLGISTPGLGERAFIVGVAAAVVVLDARRREEDGFLGNLGIPTYAIVPFAVSLPALLEAFFL